MAAPERLSLLHDAVAELRSYGVPSAVLLVGVIWMARTLGKMEATFASSKEVAASALAATEAKAAANKEVAASAVATAEAKVAAAEKVVAEVARSVAIAAELAALKAVRGEASRPAPPQN